MLKEENRFIIKKHNKNLLGNKENEHEAYLSNGFLPVNNSKSNTPKA
jgi:hypothetical protein